MYETLRAGVSWFVVARKIMAAEVFIVFHCGRWGPVSAHWGGAGLVTLFRHPAPSIPRLIHDLVFLTFALIMMCGAKGAEPQEPLPLPTKERAARTLEPMGSSTPAPECLINP